MGQIIKFPIIVLDQKANESQIGILRNLQSSVRELSSNPSTDYTVSELGIRNALNTIEVAEVSGQNITSNIPVFLSGDINGNEYFYTLSGGGILDITSTPSHVFINTTQQTLPGGGESTLITSKSINGGIYQEASKISYDVISSGVTGEYDVFHNVVSNDIIGKFLIKCTEAFDLTATTYSIGTSSNPEGFVQKFNAPIDINQLVPIEYGSYLTDKIEYIEENGNISKINKVVDSEDIKMYRYGTANSAGSMQCVIFYDKAINNDLSIGWIFPGATSMNYIDSINFATNVVSLRSRTTVTAYVGARSIENNINAIVVFGSTGYASPYKFVFSNSTVNDNYEYPNAAAKESPFNITDNNKVFGVFWAGSSAIASTTIYKGYFSNDIFQTLTPTILTIKKSGGNGCSSTNAYALGGTGLTSSVYKLSLSSFTATNTGNILSGAYADANGRYNNIRSYVCYRGSAVTARIDILTYATDTSASLRTGTAYIGANRASTSYYNHGSFVSKTYHYNAGGYGSENCIDSFSFANETSNGIYNADLIVGRMQMACSQS